LKHEHEPNDYFDDDILISDIHNNKVNTINNDINKVMLPNKFNTNSNDHNINLYLPDQDINALSIKEIKNRDYLMSLFSKLKSNSNLNKDKYNNNTTRTQENIISTKDIENVIDSQYHQSRQNIQSRPSFQSQNIIKNESN